MLASIFRIVHNSQKLIFCDSYNAKCLFWLIKASNFDIKINSEIMFFQDTLLHILFSSFMLILLENGRCGSPFKIQRAPKRAPQSTKWRLLVKNCMRCSGPGGFVSRPVLPETIILLCRFNLMVFKSSCFRWRLFHCVFFCVLFVIQFALSLLFIIPR